MKLVPIVRDQKTYAIAGQRSRGKSLLGAFLTYLQFLSGSLVFSNVWLSFPHVRIYSMDDIEHIYDADINKKKIFYLQDAERYLHARAYSSKLSQILNDVLLDFGKISCSMIMEIKQGPLNEGKSLDVSLRDAVDMWFYPTVYQYVHHPDPIVEEWLSRFMNFRKMEIMCIDGMLTSITMKTIKDLIPLCSLYDTREKVKPLVYVSNGSPS